MAGDTLAQSNGSTLLVQIAQAKALPVEYLRDELHVQDRGHEVGTSYFGSTGENIAIKRRTALKAKDGSFWPKGKALAAYGLWRLDRAKREGFLVVVEGESDC